MQVVLSVNLVKLAVKCFFECNIFFFEKKMNWLWHKYCKIKLFSDTISHGVSKQPEAYLEPSQISAFLQK